MATYNAKKLTIVKGSDTYIIDPMQGNETGYTTIPVTIAENAWSGTGPYTYVWTNSHVTSNSSVTVYLVDGVREGLMGDLNYTKTTGQITFVTDEPPIGPIPILVAIVDGSVAGVLPIDAEVVETDAVVGETTVQGALEDINGRVNAINTSKGTANGIATLDANGLVPSSQLPSYVDDVLEYASLSNFPATGESGKIYVAIDTGFNYRWSGSIYTQIAKYNEATDTVSGLMSSTDKSKLDGISSGATTNVVSNSLSDTSTTNALSAAKGKELYDALGAKSSASAVTGDDAFSKINSLNGKTSHLYVVSNLVNSLADLVTLVKTYSTNDNIRANVNSSVINALSNSTTTFNGIVDIYKASSNNCYYHVYNNQVMAYGNLQLSTGNVNIINDLNSKIALTKPIEFLETWEADNSYSYNIPNGSRIVLIGTGNMVSSMTLILINCTGTGVVKALNLVSDSYSTITTDTNRFNISIGHGASNYNVYALNLIGDNEHKITEVSV